MRSVIRQSIVLPAPAERLWEMYLDPAVHGAFTGAPVTIGSEAGAPFRAFDGQLSGTVLSVVRPRLVIQSWRSTKFADGDPDSTLILLFSPDAVAPTQGRIDLVHLDVPEHDYDGVTEGWQKHYWTPWQAYLTKPKG
jgi:activator of HSP90 ATPase